MAEYEIRTAGLSHDQNLASQEAPLKAFGQWKPEEGLTVHAFAASLNNGGYVLARGRRSRPGPFVRLEVSSTGTMSRSFP